LALDELRDRINGLDQEIVRLLDERARVSLQVAEEKRTSGDAAVYYRPEREREVLERVAGLSTGVLPTESLRAIYREIISASRELQRHHVVAYFGAPGSFTHAAALRHFGRQCEFTAIADIHGIFSAVERGASNFGVVPIENSTEGIIPGTLDQFVNSPVKIVAETYMEIHHNIMANCALSEVETVYSHPQPLAQCQAWLRRSLPEARLVEVSSTPHGAQAAKEDPTGAAIATKLAADLFQLTILEERIEDYAINRTRFWVLGRETPEPSGRDKTSLLFSTRHESGSLFRSLEAFAAHRVNLTLIQSRPTKHTAWEYVFFIDFHGHPDQENVQEAMRELERNSVFVRVLGTYPEAV
jgi:chorismate mutase/prephenate dehydratase